MRKVLRTQVVEKDGQRFIKVVKQSHRGDEFGDIRQTNKAYVFSYKGFRLASCFSPMVYNRGYCVRGNKSHDDDLCPIPSDKWLAKEQAAEKAYNEFEFEEV